MTHKWSQMTKKASKVMMWDWIPQQRRSGNPVTNQCDSTWITTRSTPQTAIGKPQQWRRRRRRRTNSPLTMRLNCCAYTISLGISPWKLYRPWPRLAYSLLRWQSAILQFVPPACMQKQHANHGVPNPQRTTRNIPLQSPGRLCQQTN